MVKLKLCAPTERYRKRGPDIVEMLFFFDFVFQFYNMFSFRLLVLCRIIETCSRSCRKSCVGTDTRCIWFVQTCKVEWGTLILYIYTYLYIICINPGNRDTLFLDNLILISISGRVLEPE